ncbi:DNA-directed RNA polymerase subunit D [Candidatus Woesearchaeota archaeon]|nr:DNA-directed RNA polymerase subunit D [Nanoarchaeota archaeon]MCB9370044.1 DNA-directed RNA polymerase subunit D [Candidatus Woesearchaeota archaeon]USN44575.1 MAG: DNA-directed RNA polymerase subunit D [Candidatus Woesearchaeota archaeon]
MAVAKQEGDEFVVAFKKGENGLANAMRRIVLDEVPTFAIEEVEVVANQSPLYNEVLALRLGLVPLVTDLKSYNLRRDCSCGGVGCALCEVKMSLKKEGEGTVYSGEIKSEDPKIVPSDKEIPITKLFGSSCVEVNLKALLGRGREHAKWAPGHAFLREGAKEEVNLVIEPFGQLSGKEIFNSALDILLGKVKELEEAL